MNHFQPQPAGMPSGSFGSRRSATTAAPSLRRLLAARLLRAPLGAIALGLTLALVGLHTGHLVAALGLAAVAVGLGLLAGLVGLTWLEHRDKLARPTPAAVAAAGLLLLAVAAWGGAVALALGRAPWLQAAL